MDRSMRRLFLGTLSTVCVALAAGAALAHPGHGATEPESAVHYVAEPVHGLPLLLIALACTAYRFGARRVAPNR